MKSKHNPQFRFFYLACIVFGGIVTHLASEFSGMGSDAEGVIFSARHLYLAVAAVLCAALAIRELRVLRDAADSGRDFKRILTVAIDTLPLAGWRFYAALAILQCSVGFASAVGEGCFFCSHDILGAGIGALVSALLLAFAARALGARFPSVASRLIRLLQPSALNCDRAWPRHLCSAPTTESSFWFDPLFNRPPPALQF